MFNAESIWDLFIQKLSKDENSLIVLETIEKAIN